MLKIKITEKSGAYSQYVNNGEMLERISDFKHGLPERWITDDQNHDPADVIEERIEVVEPEEIAYEAIIQEDGSTIERPFVLKPAKVIKHLKLKAEYSIEITDVSYEHELQECFKNRISEYPTAEQFLDVFFDGTDDDIENLKLKRLEIKAKYPKPVKE